MELDFSDCVGDFHFDEGNVRLELWNEFHECVTNENDRVWRVESGERVVFNDDLLQSSNVKMETIARFCDWLNDELVMKKWKDKKLDVMGKIFFWDDLNHDVVVAVLWKENRFVIMTHNFS